MRVGLVGGVPPFMGGGGLEVQIDKTAEALRTQGVDVFVSHTSNESDKPLDIIHMFGADPSNWNYLRNWTINRCPLVVSPVLVFDSMRQARFERYLSRLRIGPTTTSGMRRGVVLAADHVVALHDGEREQVIRWYSVSSESVSVVPNGSSAIPADGDRAGPLFFVCAGTINARKGQLALIRDWRPEFPDLVLAGPLSLQGSEAREFEEILRSKRNIVWRGRVSHIDLWSLQSRACATVSYSQSEGESLVVLDSLALNTPVLVRQSAATEHLRRRYGNGVLPFDTVDDFVSTVSSLVAGSSHTSERTFSMPPRWSEVGSRLVSIYERLNGCSL
jgi:glycosyltransferase involved in cell wall biosynthesis